MRRALLPILLLAVACAPLVQRGGWNERSHYAQVRAFNAGTPIIDAYAANTGDRARYRGHFYSDKAPGLAFLTVPVYSVARALGSAKLTEIQNIHILALLGCLIPAALLLVMAATFVERFEPGAGPAVAIMLGLGSLLLPYSTLFFSHVLGACLGFAAYYLLWWERSSRGGPLMVAASGLLAGLAVTSEFPLALLAVLLGGYAMWSQFELERVLAYAGGLVAGLVPLAVYDWWAFGSPFHISYASVAANHVGLFGLVGLRPHVALQLLFGGRGLFVLTPVLAAATVGIVLLWRAGRRGEATVASAVGVAYLVYNASYYLPFGGWSPGPRFLIPVIPFLALPLATAFRKLPWPTIVLGLLSAAMMIAATVTVPELPSNLSPLRWWRLLVHGQFMTPGAGGQVAWFAAFAALAVLTAARMTPPVVLRRVRLGLVRGGAGPAGSANR
jgi:hypothetical protein